MTKQTAEEKFKNVVRDIVAANEYPGPTAINLKLRGYKSNHLNGRETRWRREAMKKLGIQLKRPDAALPLTDYDVEDGAYL